MPDTPNTAPTTPAAVAPADQANPNPVQPTGPTALARAIPNALGSESALTLHVYANLYINRNTGMVELGARNYKTAEAAQSRATTHRIAEGLTYVGPIAVTANLTNEQLALARQARVDAEAREAERAERERIERLADGAERRDVENEAGEADDSAHPVDDGR